MKSNRYALLFSDEDDKQEIISTKNINIDDTEQEKLIKIAYKNSLVFDGFSKTKNRNSSLLH